MPLLGEAPITVYMEKKYKTNGGTGAPNSKPPLKKRKIDVPERIKDTKRYEKGSSSRTQPPIHTFFGKSKTTAETQTVAGSQRPGLITPKILHKRMKGTERGHEQLQTPPMTNEGPSRQCKSTLATVRPTLSCSNGSEKTMMSTGYSKPYPTPITMRRRSSYNRHDQETPCKRMSGQPIFSPAYPGTHDLSSQDVPSSQTQPLILRNVNLPLQAHSARQGLPNRREEGHLSNPLDDIDLLVVESSQSQPPLRIPEHLAEYPINISSKNGYRPGFDSISFECIPSSQSQEIELTIPKDELDGCALEHRNPSPQLTTLATNSTGQPILRTLSDGLFSVPIQYGILDDIFEPQDVEPGLERDRHTPQPLQGVEEDSATESDSQYEEFVKQLRDTSKSAKKLDDESVTESDSQYEDILKQIPGTQRPAEKLNNDFATELDSQYEDPIRNPVTLTPVPRPTTSSRNFNHFPQSTRNLSPIKCKPIPLSQDSGYDASQGEDFYEEGHFTDSFSQPAVASQESSPQSSPIDILALFGNTQDSYPPDFPMSLR